MINKNLNLVKNNFNEPPNNIEAEQAVIGSILLTNEVFDEIIFDYNIIAERLRELAYLNQGLEIIQMGELYLQLILLVHFLLLREILQEQVDLWLMFLKSMLPFQLPLIIIYLKTQHFI